MSRDEPAERGEREHRPSPIDVHVGARVRLPFPVIKPYLAASYQQPLSKDRPVALGSVSDLQALLTAQGSGQEFERMWTFGVGLQF